MNILGASRVSKIIEDDPEISEVVFLNVSFSQAQEAMTTLSTLTKQQHSNVSELRKKLSS